MLYVIESPFTQKRVVERVWGNAIQHLSITDFAVTPLPIPGRDEQLEIIRRVEALFRIADGVEDSYRKAQDQLDILPQSILAKAFRGELVPQDPDDEPASVLLERIRADRLMQSAADGRPRVRRVVAQRGDLYVLVPILERGYRLEGCVCEDRATILNSLGISRSIAAPKYAENVEVSQSYPQMSPQTAQVAIWTLPVAVLKLLV